ncbi:MAG: zinc-binding dehydrogenase [Deltaproteobacteria bacterium]|nr:zinc-binding dehydrogenase [Deltaproteobacteria bacterium]
MRGPGEGLELVEMRAPELEPGAALLHTTYSEVCGTDVHLADGKLEGVPYPIVPGHVSVGVLAAVRGELRDVEGRAFREGDAAAFLDVHGTCGACWYCLVAKASTRCPSRKVYGITFGASEGLLGGWAEAIWLKPGTRLLRLPEGVEPLTYIGGGCGLNTALAALDRAEVRLGDRVVVLGVGPVGQSICAFAALSGAGEVIAVGDPEPRRAFAQRMGATRTIGLDAPREERFAEVRRVTGGRGADVVIEAAGDPRAVLDALEMVRDGGRVVVAGQYTDHGDVAVNPHRLINRKHVEIRGSWGSDFSHFHRSIELMGRHHGRFPWREMVTRSYDLAHVADALEAVRRRDVVKAAIQPGLGSA